MTDLNALMKQVKMLSLDDQLKLNGLICANIKLARKIKAVEKSANVDIGDYIQFDGKTRGLVTIKVESFSRDHTKVKGRQVNLGHVSPRGVMWTVGLGTNTKILSRAEGDAMDQAAAAKLAARR